VPVDVDGAADDAMRGFPRASFRRLPAHLCYRFSQVVPRAAPDRVYVDDGLTGTHHDRPGLRQALAACRPGDNSPATSSSLVQ